MLKLKFWMNMPSSYQGDLFRALVRTGEVDLKVIFSQRVAADRLQLGWENDLTGFDFEFLDNRWPVIDAIRKARIDRSRTHIVGGLWAGTVVEAVLITLMTSGAPYVLYSEAPDPRIVVPSWKQEILTAIGKRIVGKARGILSISHFARDYFRLYGAADSAIYPFGYFRSLPHNRTRKVRAKKKGRIEVLFVGQMVARKGVDLLLSAVEPLLAAHENLFLQLVGSGELEEHYRGWVHERSLAGRITFEGSIRPAKIISRIAQADLLVLPSRWDGWGIVVNEALMASVPVIVSNKCGAADVVRDGVNGFVFSSEDIRDLQTKLSRFLADSGLRRKMRNNAGKEGGMLGAEIAAQRIVDWVRSGFDQTT